MRALVGSLLAAPACALQSVRFDELKQQLDQLKESTMVDKQDDAELCNQQQSDINGEIHHKNATSENLQDDLSRALAAVTRHGATADTSKARVAGLNAQLIRVQQDSQVVKNHYDVVRSQANAVISELGSAIKQGQSVCATFRSGLNSKNSAVLKVCDDLLLQMNKQMHSHSSALTAAGNGKEQVSSSLTQQTSSLKKALESAVSSKDNALKQKAQANSAADVAKDFFEKTKLELEAANVRLDTSVRDCTRRESEFASFVNGLCQFESHLDTINVQSVGSSLFQSNVVASMKRNVVSLLQGRASSPVLQKVVALLSESGPFDNVVDVIHKAITNLQDQINQHTTHSEKCSQGLAQNEVARTKHAVGVRAERTEFEKIQGQNGKLDAAITQDQDDVTEAAETLAQETKQRQLERAHNQAILDEYSGAVSAVEQGVSELKNHGVNKLNASPLFAAIEMISIELQEIIDNTQKTEKADSSAFSDLRANLHKRVDAVTQTIERSRMDLQEGKQALAVVQKKHGSLMDLLTSDINEFAGWKLECLSAGQDFQTRNAQRAEEIDSLKQALAALGA